jgi:protein-S-isoprenylcysteine O-methyltransferase Ste14
MAPLGAAIYIWALRSGRRADPGTLVTTGAYALVRHPIYLGFFALLVATGLLASSGVKLVAAAIVYLAGSELRIAYEEGDLADKFPDRHAEYKARTRWLYLPGAR